MSGTDVVKAPDDHGGDATGGGDLLTRPGLMVAALSALAAVPLGALVAALVDDVRAPVVVVLAALAAAEGATARVARAAREGDRDRLRRFRVAEVVVLALVVRAVTLLASPRPLGAELAGWRASPLAVVDAATVVTFLVVVAVWWSAVGTAGDLAAVRNLGRTPGRPPPLQAVARRYLAGLAAGVVASALLVVVDGALPVLVGVVVLGYAVAGLVALGRVRLASLVARWEEHGAGIPDDLVGRWRVTSAALVGLAAVGALLLPTPTGVGVVDLAVAAVRGVSEALGRLVESWERPDGPIFEFDPDEPFYDPFPEIGEGQGGRELLDPLFEVPAWVGDVWQVVAWAVGIVAIVWLASVYLRERPDLLDRLRLGALARAARRIAAAIARILGLRWLGRALTDAAGLVGSRRRARRREEGGPGRRRRPTVPGPRGELIASYLELVDAAERQGLGRAPAQTPYEYEETLATRIARGHEELDRLTDAFVAARWSTHDVDATAVSRARRDAEQLLATLRAEAAARDATADDDRVDDPEEGDDDERRPDQRPHRPPGGGG